MSLLDRLDVYLDSEDLAAVWFAKPYSFAWLTGGGDNDIDRASDTGVAAAGYDGDGITVVTDNIEAARIEAEEVPAEVTIEQYPWHASSLAAAVADVSPSPGAADFDVPGFDRVDASPLRHPLTDEQIETYDRLAEDVAGAVEGVARGAAATDTERTVAAELEHALATAGANAPVVLVGGGERSQTYRHFTPTDAELESYALLSVVGERNGQCVSCTRTVAFDAPEWLEDRTRDAMRVETTALAATQAVGREGGTAGDVFGAIQDAYAELGWPGEWENHHQGGAAGYAGREWVATPDNDTTVTLPMAYAWNPTVQGAKSEGTQLVTPDAVRPMSMTGEWPTRTVEAVGYDLALERPAPLDR